MWASEAGVGGYKEQTDLASLLKSLHILTQDRVRKQPGLRRTRIDLVTDICPNVNRTRKYCNFRVKGALVSVCMPAENCESIETSKLVLRLDVTSV
jgi:hypothetical protein